MDKSRELKLACDAAKKAGDFLKKHEDIHVDSLYGKDIKISSDKTSEQIIMDILDESKLSVLSEECGFKGSKGDTYWIVDPLDGTLNYYKGMDELCCVSVALWHDRRPILGAVYRFATDELFYGGEGFGAYLNGSPITTSGLTKTKESVMATGFPLKRSYDSESLSEFVKQVQCFKKVRMLGAAALMASFVACGRVDAYFEDGIMIWDVAAAAAIVKAAGGAVELRLLDDCRTTCKCFSTERLLEDFYAEGL